MRLFDLKGKVAIVTGANGDIGRAIATGLAEAGADVAVVDQALDTVPELTEELGRLGRRCLGIQCDITDEEELGAAVAACLRDLGGLNILINAAGVTGGGPAASMHEDEWDRVMDVNLKASFRFCQAVYPALTEAGGGKIVNIGSIYSFLGSAVASHYAVSKGGVLQMTRSLALAWAGTNIQVNAILPGFVNTSMTAPILENDAFYQQIIERSPYGRFAEPQEMAGAAIFLSSAASDFVTGHGIVVDGGYSVS